MAIVLGNMTFTGGFQFTNSGSTPPGPTPLSDQYFQYTTLLLDGLGTNGAQNNTFLDSSSNNFTVTRNGNTTQGSFTPFSHDNGYWSNYFDGNGDYLTGPIGNATLNTALNILGGDFTVEFWWYSSSSNPQSAIVTNFTSSGVNGWVIRSRIGAIALDVWTNNTKTEKLSAAVGITANTWYHIAVVNLSNNYYFYVNGVEVGMYSGYTRTAVANPGAGTGLGIGAYIQNLGFADYVSGYISNLRIVKGTAVYTSNFTPSTTPLTAIANTSLLTCQSNRFRDNSSNNFVVTSVGNAAVTLFQPFTLSTEYNSSTMGGSGYFDGSDGLTVPYTTVIGTQDFTVAVWIYMTATPNGQSIVFATPWSSPGFQLYITDSFVLAWQMGGAGVGFTSSNAIKLNTWHHVAWTRTGGNCRLFVDGVLLNTTANAVNVSANPVNLFIGHRDNSLYFTGYMSSVNFMLGTALYTANYTPPTAPTTSAAQTQLLLNFTNAGVVDSTGFNNAETVGNAQISTAQSKWGGSSMYFDGTNSRLTIANNAAFNQTGSWTVEMWIYSVKRGAAQYFYTQSTSGYAQLTLNSSNFLEIDLSGVGVRGTSTAVIPANTWTHVAMVSNGTQIRLFVDGTLQGTPAAFTGVNSAKALTIGSYDSPSLYFGGYIQGLRVTNGVARYTTTFTPPTDY